MPAVTYQGASEDQVYFGGNDPRYTLEIGAIYELEAIDVHDYYTLYKLEGVEGWFNSVAFKGHRVINSTASEVVENH